MTINGAKLFSNPSIITFPQLTATFPSTRLKSGQCSLNNYLKFNAKEKTQGDAALA